jgi:hydrogenase/urease accessory protein HupE
MKDMPMIPKMLSISLLCIGMASTVQAHDPGLSSATVTLQRGHCNIELIFSKVDAAILFRNFGNDGEIPSPAELAADLEKFAPSALDLQLDGQTIPCKTVRGRADDAGNVIFCLDYERGATAAISLSSRWITVLPPGHREYVSIQRPGGEALLGRLLSASEPSAALRIAGQADTTHPSAEVSFGGFIGMGVMHIWTGYDHLLFLFGLLAVTRQVKTVLKIVTCFTVAHSLTLAIASLNIVTLPSRIVEPMIAASIVFVGVENFLRNGEPKGRWLLTFAFGLIHGFGFASALREAGVGEHGGSVAVPLVSFNLGVELGQMAIAAIALPLIWKLRNQPRLARRWIPATSSVVGLLGAYWLIQRIAF